MAKDGDQTSRLLQRLLVLATAESKDNFAKIANSLTAAVPVLLAVHAHLCEQRAQCQPWCVGEAAGWVDQHLKTRSSKKQQREELS
jgi:hypothetical protein